MSERIGYAPPEATAEKAVQQSNAAGNGHANGRINGHGLDQVFGEPYVVVPPAPTGENGNHNGHHETAIPLQGTIELGAVATETEVDFGIEVDMSLPAEGTIFDRDAMRPAVLDTPPKGWHKALMRQQERDWNKRKRTQRLDNYAHAHGQFINTGSGRQYREHGIPRPNQHK